MKKIIAVASILFIQQGFAQTTDRSKAPKAGPAPVINIGTPVTYKLPNGITVLVVENHKLPKVTATLSIDAGPITEGSKAGTLDLMGEMLNEGTTLKSKAAFDEAVDKMGASLNLSFGSGSVSALTRYFEPTFLLLAEALRKPAFPAESFDKLKSQMITGLKSNEKNAKVIATRVTDALLYGKDHPAGEMTTEETVKGITLEDIKKAYAKYVTPSRSYLTFVGDIKPEVAKAIAIKALGTWKGNTLSLPVLKTVENVGTTEIDVVDVPNAVQSEIKVTNLVTLPMSSPDYFAVLLANDILGGGASARLFTNLREKHGFTYGAYSSVSAGRFQTSFTAAASVRNEKVDSAVTEFMQELARIRDEKISTAELQDAKNKYNGTFALGLENPARTARFASDILINNLPADFYKTYLQRINAVTTEDIQRVAQKYFSVKNTRIMGVGKGAAILPGLKKLGYPVKEYDKFGQPVAGNPMAVGITISAKQLVANYIEAIGGEAALKKVNSIAMTGEMDMRGQKLATSLKKMAPNMEKTEISMAGTTVMKQLFNGSTGFQEQGGSKKDMEADVIADKKENKSLFPQLFYSEGYTLKVDGTEKVGTATAYKLNVTSPGGKSKTEYYDSKSWLLLKSEVSLKSNGVDLVQSNEYSDYRKVGDVLFPHKVATSIQAAMGTTEFTTEIKSISLNQGVSAEDFK